MKDFYAILGISITAEKEVIDAAYKALVKKYHPDVFKGSTKIANERIREINEAYDTLSKTNKKKRYDEEFLSEKETGSFDDFTKSDFDESEDIFVNDWNILIDIFPNAETLRQNLSKLSRKFSH